MAKARFNKLAGLAAIIAAVFSLSIFFITLSGGAVLASAASAYSSALEDLRKDSSFNPSDYLAGGSTYTLDVIQVAEGVDGELFIYVYQPYGKLTGSSISISKTIGDNYSPKKYGLTLLNSEAVFYKYKVAGFELEPDALRYYNISQIWRKYDRQIDGNNTGGQTLEEVPYAVGKLFTVTTVGGEVSYTLKETETVEIVKPYHGFVRYPNGTSWFTTGKCDGHFITFDVGNYDIDRLLSADVSYRTQDYTITTASGENRGELSEVQYKTINHDEKASNDVSGLFGVKYNWDRISRTADFVNDVDLQDEDLKKELLARTWVINFLETDYTTPLGLDNVHMAVFGGSLGLIWNTLEFFFGETTGTLVKEVAILRLEFEVDGKVYNLGTVSNVITGSEKPAETKPDALEDFLNKIAKELSKVPWWGWVLIIIAVALIVVGVLAIFFPALRVVFTVLWTGIKWLGIGLWWLISAPFKGIAALIERRKERKAAEAAAAAKAEKKQKKSSSSGKKKTTAKKSSTTTTTKKKTAAEGKK